MLYLFLGKDDMEETAGGEECRKEIREGQKEEIVSGRSNVKEIG